MEYYTYRQFGVIRDLHRRRKEEWVTGRYRNRNHDHIQQQPAEKKFRWIEKLLKTPLDVEGRYYCTWRILAPYLINVKGLSKSDAFDIISSWLDQCNSLRRLSFYSVKK